MKNEELIGRKFRGFKFEGQGNVYYISDSMDKFIDEVLTIEAFDTFGNVVSNNRFSYPLEEVKKHLIPENEVIKVLNEEHGKKVIQYWKSRGVDTKSHRGFLSGMYYGVVNGEFNNYQLGYVTNSKAKIITIPEDKPEIKWVWVRSDENLKWMKRILITDLGEQFEYRYIVVSESHTDKYIQGEKTMFYIGYVQISYTDPNEEIEKEIKELENQINVLKSKLCK